MRRIYGYNLPNITRSFKDDVKYDLITAMEQLEIFPLIKADVRLEFTAINSLKNGGLNRYLKMQNKLIKRW